MSRILTGLGAGFVAAYGLFSFQKIFTTPQLPHTINDEWAAATVARNAKKERVAAEPIALNPRHYLG